MDPHWEPIQGKFGKLRWIWLNDWFKIEISGDQCPATPSLLAGRDDLPAGWRGHTWQWERRVGTEKSRRKVFPTRRTITDLKNKLFFFARSYLKLKKEKTFTNCRHEWSFSNKCASETTEQPQRTSQALNFFLWSWELPSASPASGQTLWRWILTEHKRREENLLLLSVFLKRYWI